MLDRRSFLSTPLAAGALGAGLASGPHFAQAASASANANAAEFGVRPGLDVDQTPTLQDAVDRLADSGGTLLLPPGRYLVEGLRLRRGVTLAGAGPATRLVASGRAPVAEASGADLAGLANLAAEAPAARGNTDAPPVLRFRDCEGLSVSGLVARGGGNGLDLARVSGAVRNSALSGMANAGLFSIDATGLEVAHNLVEDCGNNGIQIWRSATGPDGSIVTANRIRNIRADSGGEGQNGNGVNIFRAGGVSVTGNRIEACAYSALRSNAGSDCVFANNSCTRLGEVAIYAEFGFQGALISANLVEDAASGISITNFNDGGRLAVCSGNLVRNLHTRDHYDARGNGISAEADTLVTGNVVENAPTAGIGVGYGRYLRNVLVTNNIVRDCRWGIGVSVADGAGPAVIGGNLIAGAREAAIQGLLFGRAEGGDLASDGSAGRPHLTVTGNVATSA